MNMTIHRGYRLFLKRSKQTIPNGKHFPKVFINV